MTFFVVRMRKQSTVVADGRGVKKARETRERCLETQRSREGSLLLRILTKTLP